MSAQIVKSPVLKEYLRLQPCCPNLRRPNTKEWKKHKANNADLNSIGLSEEAIFSSSNKLQALLKLDFKSAGASFMTLMQDCSNDSGMVLKWGSGGGSADKKQRKSKCDPSAVVSKYQKNRR